jgi:hypothetical protein
MEGEMVNWNDWDRQGGEAARPHDLAATVDVFKGFLTGTEPPIVPNYDDLGDMLGDILGGGAAMLATAEAASWDTNERRRSRQERQRLADAKGKREPAICPECGAELWGLSKYDAQTDDGLMYICQRAVGEEARDPETGGRGMCEGAVHVTVRRYVRRGGELVELLAPARGRAMKALPAGRSR